MRTLLLTLLALSATGATKAQTGPALSTEARQHWYYIVNQGNNDYSTGKVMSHDASTNYLSFGDRAFTADRLWSFWQGENGKVAIKNYNGVYVGTAPAGTGGATAVQGITTANAVYAITAFTGGGFTIGDGNGEPLHAQKAGARIVRWQAAAGNASIWAFDEADMSDLSVRLSRTVVQQGKVTTGRGNVDQGILRATLHTEGLSGTLPLTQVKGRIVAGNLADVVGVRAYMASNARELFVDRAGKMPWREQNGTLAGTATVAADGSYSIDLSGVQLGIGANYLWIALDIAADAREGNTVDATITEYTVGGQTVAEPDGNPQYAATIFLSEGAALMPMDNGSLYYRIPAITATADGRRLVVLTDDRVDHNTDLPNHVWLVAQYSDDGGTTWSRPKRVAGTAETGGDYGHGDAQIITNRFTGEIIGIMTSSPTSNAGFWGSTVDKPQAWKVFKSRDGGETWSVPVDHTRSLYAKGSPNEHIKGGFSGSGAGLQKRDGTLISPFVGRTTDNVNHYYNFVSKDGGDTWELFGTSGTTSADEPKILERNNGDLAISVRSAGFNFTNVTSDDGLTWKKAPQTRFTTGISGNACDGEYMVWCSTIDGNPWNIALQTLPNNPNRQNVSIALSTDEGETFGTPKTICPRGSAYSAATVMGDGTLAVYYEENGVFGGYTMRCVRFSLDWASNGAYKFTPEKPFRPIQSQVTLEVPENGWQTVVSPFACELPEGLDLYESWGELQTEGTAPDTRRTLGFRPVEGRTLTPHVPYAVQGTPGTYVLERGAWTATALPIRQGMAKGVLRGKYVSSLVRQNAAESIYNNLRAYTALNGQYAFRRITKGAASRLNPYTCYVELPQADEQYLYPALPGTTAIAAPRTTAQAAALSYDLSGRRSDARRGVLVQGGRKVIK